MTILYDALKVPPPHPVTCTVGEYVIAVLGIPLRFNDFVVLDAFAATPAGSPPLKQYSICTECNRHLPG
jgi:hypothetical protein